MKIKDARSLPSIAQENLRREAVKSVREGMTQVDTARLFGVTRQAVGKWVKADLKGGSEQLKAGRRGRPRGGTLQSRQVAQIIRLITRHHPVYLKLPFCLWTRDAVGALIEQRFGKSLSVWTVGRYLKEWGFTPQKSLDWASEHDPVAVRRWREEEYPRIRAEAKRMGAAIYWGNEIGIQPCCAEYGRNRRTSHRLGTRQFFVNDMISAITNRGKLYFMVYDCMLSSRVYLAFLRRLIKQVGRMLFVITENHPVLHSKEAKRWLAKRDGQIRLFFLPGFG